MSLFLFYLLVVLLPTQLGRHFFFDFSHILGIRSDYLAPTIFLTDIIIIFVIILSIIDLGRHRQINPKHEIRNPKQYQKLNFQNPKQRKFWPFNFRILGLFRYSNFGFRILIFVIFYLLFNTLFIATNKWVALYKLVKIIEFFVLGFIITKLKPKISTVITVLSIAVFYSSVIAIWQFIIQRSIGDVFWWLGERTFSVSTPGIANFSLPTGGLVLRPYATFSHPNVLGGFLSIVLPLILIVIWQQRKKTNKFHYIWLMLSLGFGIVTLILAFSRAAWIIAFFGFSLVLLHKESMLANWVKKNIKKAILGFYSLLILSVSVPIIEPLRKFVNLGLAWQERADLISASFGIIGKNLLFGVGLNNFIVNLPSILTNTSSLYILQPVHNIYILVLSETGLVGLVLFLTFLALIYRWSLGKPILVLTLTQLYLLGMFDHYLLTLQQGQLLLTLFVSLGMCNRYNESLDIDSRV